MPWQAHWQFWQEVMAEPELEPAPEPPPPDPELQHKALLLHKRLGQLNALINQRRYRKQR